MALLNPSTVDFKARFVRDFPYNADPTLGVMDSDIMTAFQDTNVEINPVLWSQAEYTQAYLFLTAHFLSLNLQASSQGFQGKGSWLSSSQSAGISESYSIPQQILDHPLWSAYSATTYGKRYAMLVIPKLVGSCFTVRGRTQP